MAKARVCRHYALCPKRGSNRVKKDRHSRGKQQCKRNRRRRKRHLLAIALEECLNQSIKSISAAG